MKVSTFEFGRFRLFPQQRRLELAGTPVRLGSRELDLLLALVENEGKILSQAELIGIVWQNRHVADASVRIHISGLRRALAIASPAEQFIVTVSGKGYTFGGPVIVTKDGAGETAGTAPTLAVPRAPLLMTKVIGRASMIAAASAQLQTSRLVTLTGFAGIGKTTVALAIAAEMATHFPGDICFVDLSPIDRPGLVAATIAIALGIGARADDPMIGIVSHLRERETLVILDNCEHLIEEVAVSATRLLAASPRSKVLATSREVLNVPGEWVCRLKPLRLPPTLGDLSTREILSSPAVELFVDRARASLGDFELDQDNALVVAELCRKLEGIPLALEFAASRVQEFGIIGVASRLADRFSLLNKGRRTAPPRHKTLGATIEWSVALLDPAENAAFESLSIFSDSFTLESATRVIANGPSNVTEAESRIHGLLSKSMIFSNRVGDTEHYRMLEMTREFAAHKLRAGGSLNAIAYRHALDCTAVLEQAEASWDNGITARWLALYGHKVADIRRAMDWARSPEGDIYLAVKLTALASALFIPLGLTSEYLSYLRQAIALNRTVNDSSLDARMHATLGVVLWHTRGHLADSGSREAFAKAADVSRRIGDVAGELRAISGLSAAYLLDGDYDLAIDLMGRFAEIPKGSSSFVEHRTLAHTNFYVGNNSAASFHSARGLNLIEDRQDNQNIAYSYDQRQIPLRLTHAKTLWVSGLLDEAMRLLEQCIEDARAGENALSYCQALATGGCPFTFVTKGREAARNLVDLLVSTAERHSLPTWLNWGRTYKLKMKVEDSPSESPPELQGESASNPIRGTQLDYLSILGDGYVDDWMVQPSRRRSASFCTPELVRLRGEMAVREGDLVKADRLFKESERLASDQGAKPWQLRTAISLARNALRVGERQVSKDTLEKAMGLFREGFGSVDFMRASALLREI